MIELITSVVPMVVGLFTENQEVAQVAVENKEVLTGVVGAVLIDWGLRLFPTKEHKSVLKIAIAVLEGLLAGAKKVDEKVAVIKK